MKNIILYKLNCKDINISDIYVGQTSNFNQRYNAHRTSSTNSISKIYNLKVYKFIREHGGIENWEMNVIENYEAIDGLDARKRERHWIETLQATLNSNIPSRTREEYKLILKDRLVKYREKILDSILNPVKKDYSELDSDFVTDLLLDFDSFEIVE